MTPTALAGEDLQRNIVSHVDAERLVEVACSLVDIPSPTGSEQAMAERVRAICGGWPAQCPGNPSGDWWRADANVQRSHGHLLLRARAAP